MKHFRLSFLVTAIGLGLAFYVGETYSKEGGLHMAYIAALLAVLEVSLSFDNAVVNAKVLDTMEPKWQQRFITFGIPIAVFGMRFIFPLLIVALTAGIGMIETFHMAVDDPHKYHETLEANEAYIFSFGGAFLLMVFLDFWFDDDREHKWIAILEDNVVVNKAGEVNNIEMMIATALGLVLVQQTSGMPHIDAAGVAIAFFGGMLLHSMIASLDDLLGTDGVRSGIMGFIYLEVLDASFSFDGVIGAFALSSNIFIIMIGLGIGAMFVRSLTLFLVEKKTLAEYRFLEHGAHYAILALALIMLIKIFTPIPEVIVGTIGVGLILIATAHSVMVNRREAKEEGEKGDG